MLKTMEFINFGDIFRGAERAIEYRCIASDTCVFV